MGQDEFPSLAQSSPASNTPAKSLWGAGPRIKATVSKQPLASETFTLTDIDLSGGTKDGRPATLGEIMKGVMTKYKVKIEASSNQKTRQTTFHLKADSQKDLAKARRDLLSSLSPVVSRFWVSFAGSVHVNLITGYADHQCACVYHCRDHRPQR